MKFLRTPLFLAVNFTISFSIQAATECTTVTDIPTLECEALLRLYESTQGVAWAKNIGWNSTDTPCSWDGITCDNHHVIKIDLYMNGLTGALPVELGNFSHLQFLSLGRNQLTGAIPVELASLSNLQILYLDESQLSGEIPTELGNLSKLQSLYLSYNHLSGAIPAELGNLSNLQHLDLDNNELSGAIPAKLGQLSKLQTLQLSGNHLGGTIPTELGQLSNLQYLNLSYNQLIGAIPAEFGKLSNLQELNLDENKLSGAIPAEFGQLSNLQVLHLFRNSLNGMIPVELGQLSNLQVLNLGNNLLGRLGNNHLSGAIPTELGQLSNLNFLNLGSNQLSGVIPAELGQLSKLQYLELSGNNLCGDIPSSLKNLNNLNTLYSANMNGNALNIIINDPELVIFLNTKMPGWESQHLAPDICIVFPELGQGRVVNFQEKESFTQAFFLGGIAVNQGSYQQQAILSLAESVEIRGIMKVAPIDVGKTADIFVYAETTFPFLSSPVYYMVGEGLSIDEWDRHAENLVSFMKNVSLADTQYVSLYQGRFYYPGTLKIFFGYRLSNGTLVSNSQPIVVDIKEEMENGG